MFLTVNDAESALKSELALARTNSFGRAATSGENDTAYLESVQRYIDNTIPTLKRRVSAAEITPQRAINDIVVMLNALKAHNGSSTPLDETLKDVKKQTIDALGQVTEGFSGFKVGLVLAVLLVLFVAWRLR